MRKHGIWKGMTAAVVFAGLAVLMTGCGKEASGSGQETETEAVQETETEAVQEAETKAAQETEVAVKTGDPEKKAILVVSFGTSYNETRKATIGAVEEAITAAFPEYEVRRAFTSQMIIDKLKERDGEEIDNVEEALANLVAEGVGTLIIQPTHVMNGHEYDEMRELAAPYEKQFASVKYGKPLLQDEKDYEEMVGILTEETKAYQETDTAVVFMGHGTDHEANSTYEKLDGFFKDAGYDNYYVGTVEAAPSLEDVMAEVNQGSYEKVVLLPLMIVAGDHASNDMAGDEEGSWKTAFKSEGYEVECILKGMGEYPGVQEMFVAHAQDATGE